MRCRIVGVLLLFSLSLNVAAIIYLFVHWREAPPVVSAPGSSLWFRLSEEQSRQIRPIRQKYETVNREIEKKIDFYREKMLEALKKTPADREGALNAINAINELQKQIQVNATEEILEMKQYMTDHQCDCLMDELKGGMNHESKDSCSASCCNPDAVPASPENKK